jgi:hypothetical protein
VAILRERGRVVTIHGRGNYVTEPGDRHQPQGQKPGKNTQPGGAKPPPGKRNAPKAGGPGSG